MITKDLIGRDVWVDGCPSHLGVLAALIAGTKGPIVEFGSGFTSTPLFVAASLNRQAVTIEDDCGWRAFFNGLYGNRLSGWHLTSPIHRAFISVHPSDYGVTALWSVAFVDSRPSRDRRGIIDRLRAITDFIVVHDTEPQREHIYQYGGILDTFRYRWDFRGYSPYTTVVSDKRDPADLLGHLSSGKQSDLDSSWIERHHKV